MPAIVNDYSEILKRLRGDDWWTARKDEIAGMSPRVGPGGVSSPAAPPAAGATELQGDA